MPHNVPIAVQINHRVEEHVAAERLYYAKRSKWKKADRIVAVCLLLFGIVTITFAGIRWWTIIWLILAPLEFFNCLSIVPWVTRHRFKRTPKFRERNDLTFSEEGIHFQTSTLDSHLKWDFYEGMLENENLILLLYAHMYTVIPKRCFQSVEELNAFMALARDKLGSRLK